MVDSVVMRICHEYNSKIELSNGFKDLFSFKYVVSSILKVLVNFIWISAEQLFRMANPAFKCNFERCNFILSQSFSRRGTCDVEAKADYAPDYAHGLDEDLMIIETWIHYTTRSYKCLFKKKKNRELKAFMFSSQDSKKQLSMTRKCHTHRPQIKPRHCKAETLNTNGHTTQETQ